MKLQRMSRSVLYALVCCAAFVGFQLMWSCSVPPESGETQQETSRSDGGVTVEQNTSDNNATEQGVETVQDTSTTEPSTATETLSEPKAEPALEPGQEPKVEVAPEPKAEPPPVDAGTPEESVMEAPPEPVVLEKKPEAVAESTPVEKTPPKTCTKDADCGTRTCLQAGKICKRNTPICRAGLCVDLKVDIPDTTCDPQGGVCRAPKPKCAETCDCAQGLMCIKDASGDGTCIAGIVPVFCCNNGGCPAGKACVQRGGGSSTCP